MSHAIKHMVHTTQKPCANDVYVFMHIYIFIHISMCMYTLGPNMPLNLKT